MQYLVKAKMVVNVDLIFDLESEPKPKNILNNEYSKDLVYSKILDNDILNTESRFNGELELTEINSIQKI